MPLLLPFSQTVKNTAVIQWFFFMALAAQSRAMASSFLRFFRDQTQRRNTVGRTPLDEWSARRRDTHNGQTWMPPAGFEPTISAGERPQTYALDRAATGTGIIQWLFFIIITRWLLAFKTDICNCRISKIAWNVPRRHFVIRHQWRC